MEETLTSLDYKNVKEPKSHQNLKNTFVAHRMISYVLGCAFAAVNEALLASSEWYVSSTTFESWSMGSRLRPGHCFGQLCLAFVELTLQHQHTIVFGRVGNNW